MIQSLRTVSGRTMIVLLLLGGWCCLFGPTRAVFFGNWDRFWGAFLALYTVWALSLTLGKLRPLASKFTFRNIGRYFAAALLLAFSIQTLRGAPFFAFPFVKIDGTTHALPFGPLIAILAFYNVKIESMARAIPGRTKAEQSQIDQEKWRQLRRGFLLIPAILGNCSGRTRMYLALALDEIRQRRIATNVERFSSGRRYFEQLGQEVRLAIGTVWDGFLRFGRHSFRLVMELH